MDGRFLLQMRYRSVLKTGQISPIRLLTVGLLERSMTSMATWVAAPDLAKEAIDARPVPAKRKSDTGGVRDPCRGLRWQSRICAGSRTNRPSLVPPR